jgi:hypothetical protein
MRAYSLLLFSLLTLYSCRELVKDEFPDFQPVPTVNSILVAGELLKVHVSLAGKLDSNKLALVDNASVLLYVNEEYKETLNNINEGIYSSSIVVEPLKTYRCEVSIPGYQTVSCSEALPEPAKISNILHTNKAGIDEEGMTYPAITFTFNNNPDEKQYFEVIIRLIQSGHESAANLGAIIDPIILNEGLPIALFSNDLIKDSTYTMTINYTTGSAGSTNGEPVHTNLYPWILALRSVRYYYYQYVKQLYLYEKGRYPEFLAGSITASSLHTNVKGGYGIFAGYSSVQSVKIDPNKPVK